MSLKADITSWLPDNEPSNWLDWEELELGLDREYSQYTVFPPKPDIFRCLSLVPFSKVRVVILGQDPYHRPGQAQGLSFSVPKGLRVPPSLANIFQEQRSLGVENGEHGDLSFWAEQGVLLLNSVLTVREGKPGSHKRLGWDAVTTGIIKSLNQSSKRIIFVLWGADAKKKKSLLDETKHLVLESAHPSPLSAYRGFMGCGHFSQINEDLTNQGQDPIQWQLPT